MCQSLLIPAECPEWPADDFTEAVGGAAGDGEFTGVAGPYPVLQLVPIHWPIVARPLVTAQPETPAPSHIIHLPELAVP